MDYHQPVLAQEVTNLLKPQPGKIFLDATLGHGGHTLNLLEQQATVYGLDADPASLSLAQKRIGPNPGFHPILANFKDIAPVYQSQINQPLDGILFDLGLNLHQLKHHNRGFSFNDTTLDMRLDPNDPSPTAANLVNHLPAEELTTIFAKYTQQPLAKEISHAIVAHRRQQKITSGCQLAQIVREVCQLRQTKSSKNPATQIFLALRIAVNQEFSSLTQALQSCLSISLPQTTIVIISFHSGEDRIVKNFVRLHHLPSNPIIKPSFGEVRRNPLSRSAVLRWFNPRHDLPPY